MNLPAHQYKLNCEDHDCELDAVVEVRLGRGDEPPDDQGVHHVGAVGEPAERDENLPIEQNVDVTWDEIPRCLQPVWKRRLLHRTTAHSTVRAVRPWVANQ